MSKSDPDFYQTKREDFENGKRGDSRGLLYGVPPSAYDNTKRNFLYGLPASIHDLPKNQRRFFGRHKEMKKLLSSLEDPEEYHCCLYGLPGVGKSRLAIEFAHEVRNLKKGWSVLYIDAKEITKNSELESEIHRIVLQECKSSTVTADNPIPIRFAETVRVFPNLLLLLDGCDSILVNDTERQLFVSMLSKMVAAGRRDFTILTTSCSRYGLCCKEQLKLPVEPLDDEAAVELLSFWCPEELTAPIRDLSQTCRGLPRYLEAVGAVMENYIRIGILSPDELLNNMRTDPIRKLDKYLKTSKPSTSFLELFKNMPEDEKTLFWCLSLFSGTFSRANGAKILGMTESAFACVLMRLFDYALVKRHDNGEYSQHGLIRQFALQEAEKANCPQFNKSREVFKNEEFR